MKLVSYTDWQQLPAEALFARSEKASLFCSRTWFEGISRFAPAAEGDLLLACVVRGPHLLALLPLVRNTEHGWSALRHPYSTHFSLLLAEDEPQQVLACLVAGLAQLPVQSLLLEPVADDDGRIVGLQQQLVAAGFRCSWLFRLYNWIYRTGEQTGTEYMASRPARLCNTIARKQRKLEREHGYRIQLFTGTAALQAMPDFHAVYRASWKAQEQHGEFLAYIVREFSRRGWTRLAVLYVGEQAVAAQLWFVLHGKASIFRLAHDQAWDQAWKQYSPGSILTRFLMQQVIDIDKVRQIDFLTGNDSCKQDWMSERRQRFALSCIKATKPATGHVKFVTTMLRRFRRPAQAPT